ncbi:HTH-type transcriptional regulator immR, partial [Dysosmobacter welbionis]
DGGQLQMLHKGARCLPAALQLKGHHTAGAVGQVLLCQGMVLVPWQAAVADGGHLGMCRQELRHRLAVLTVAGHAHMEALQPQVQIEGVLGGLDGAEVPHQLGGALGDEGALPAELLRVGDAVVAVVRGAEAGELVRVGHPVELAGVHDGAAYRRAVAVHVLGGGVGDDVGAPFKGPAVHRSGEGVVHDQRHAMGVGGLGELLDVQHRQGRVGDGLAEHRLGVGPEGGFQLLVGAVRGDEGDLDTHFRHGDGDQIEGTAVDGGRGDDVVPAGADVEQREEV